MKITLGYSPLSKKIHLAKMRVDKNGNAVRVGDKTEDVTNQAAQLAAILVIDEGGKISWDMGDHFIVLEARKESK